MATAAKGKRVKLSDRAKMTPVEAARQAKLSAREAKILLEECENQWHWSADAVYRGTVNKLVAKGLLRKAWHPNGDLVKGWEVTGLGREIAEGLKQLRPEATIGTHSPSRSPKVAARPQSVADTSTYSGRLGAVVRKRREELGMSVKDFAASLKTLDAEVTVHAVYHWEKGLRPIPLNALPAIAKILKVAIRDLLPAK